MTYSYKVHGYSSQPPYNSFTIRVRAKNESVAIDKFNKKYPELVPLFCVYQDCTLTQESNERMQPS